jgi:TatD DNase family protein
VGTTSELRWVDSHCHLQLEVGEARFEPDDAAAQVARAHAAGVEWMVCVGTGLETSRQALDLAAVHPTVYATVGLHPHDATRLDAEWEALSALATEERCVAIGEAGFDLYYEHSPVVEQEAAFRRHIDLAKRVGRPLMIHSRDAWDDTFRVLDDEGVPERTIFHCFTGGPDEARAALDRGCYLSFSGIVSFKTADDVRAASAIAPPDRVLVETDSPYLAPAPHRGKPNEPAFVSLVGAALAAARRVEPGTVAEVTRENAARVFGVER